MKITYLNKREGEKRFRGMIWGQKLTLNHPSLVDEGQEIKVSADGSQKKERERELFILKRISNFQDMVRLIRACGSLLFLVK